MMRRLSLTLIAAASAAVVGLATPMQASASRWEVRQEVREGAWEVHGEKREAARELRRCRTRECARREVCEDYSDRYQRGDNRWYRDGRYWDRYEYERRYYRRRDNGDGDLLQGALVGAAVVGVAVAVANSGDG